jgi:molybdate transport system substrate-binding protein
VKLSYLICAAFGLAAVTAGPAPGAELRIFGSRVTKMVVDDIGPRFEQATGHKLVVVTDVAAVMKRRIEAGEPFDVAVLVDFQTDALIKIGKLVADTRADLMRAGIGVAVRRGASKPDIGTSSTRCLRRNRSPTSRKARAPFIWTACSRGWESPRRSREKP